MIHRDKAASATSQPSGERVSIDASVQFVIRTNDRRSRRRWRRVRSVGRRCCKAYRKEYMDVCVARSLRLCKPSSTCWARAAVARPVVAATAAAERTNALNIDERHLRLLSRVFAFQSTLHINCAVKVVWGDAPCRSPVPAPTDARSHPAAWRVCGIRGRERGDAAAGQGRRRPTL